MGKGYNARSTAICINQAFGTKSSELLLERIQLFGPVGLSSIYGFEPMLSLAAILVLELVHQ